MSLRTVFLSFAFLAAIAPAQSRTEDIIYLKSNGAAFTLDVVKPAKPNKAAVLFMVSGGWISNHGMIKSMAAAPEKALTDAGFTVIEVVHGAQPRYKGAEIVDQVQTAVQFVRAHAAEYGFEENRLGVTGISSGGHLSLMIGGSSKSPVNAVAAIAPPTDMLNWGKPNHMFIEEPLLKMFVPALGLDPKATEDDIRKVVQQLSPISFVTAQFPPTLIVHGDKDTLVPLQQAQVMDSALGKAGVAHKLEIIPGGGHDDKTFVAAMPLVVQWFKETLLK